MKAATASFAIFWVFASAVADFRQVLSADLAPSAAEVWNAAAKIAEPITNAIMTLSPEP
jgi:hypothetical protein